MDASTYNKTYTIGWDGTGVSAFTSSSPDVNWDRIIDPEPEPEILEDGPWSPLYEYEDYVGIAHAMMAIELGLDD